MPGRGPAPKDSARRQRRNAQPGAIELDAGARVKKAPALPPRSGRGRGWSAGTKRWYEVWRRSPQATLFSATDWQRLHMLAALVEDYFATPSKEVLAEIRLNEAKLGATPEDRQRLRWTIVDEGADSGQDRAKPSRRRKDPRHLELVQGGS